MRNDSNNMSRVQWWIAIVAVVLTLSVGGCGEFSSSKSASVESSRIIKDLRRVHPKPDPNVPLPSFFTSPPKILPQLVGGKEEFKLFYFGQHHTSPELEQIVSKQFASALFDAKGKSTRKVDYNVSSNAATNQLIVRCPELADAEAVLDFLREVDVPPIQVKISCLISEIYADRTLDWETTIALQDLLGEGITAVPAGQAFGTAIPNILEEPSTIAAFPGGSLRELGRAKMGLKIGYLSHSGNFLAMVDTLESEGYLKILMNPTLEVINGKQAKVMSSQQVPIQQAFLRSGNSDLFEQRTEYENVVDSLTITPHVFADGYIGLETSILLGSKLTPEGIKQVPIITKKQIDNKENRIRPGESLIIGGLRKVERRDVLRGVPFLRDIPLLGILFSGSDFEERAVETVFILTPTISTGGIPREEMMDEVRRSRGEPTADDKEVGLDPFGSKARKNEEARRLEDAEQARLEAEAEKAVARNATRDAEDRIEKAESETELAKMRSARTVAEAQKMIAEAAAAKADSEAKAKAAVAAKAVADKATADAAKVKADAVKATADAATKVKAAAQAQAAAAKVAADATKTKEDATKAKAAADVLAAAAEKATAEADAKTKAADAAKATAEKATADAAQTKKEAEEAKAEAAAKVAAAEKATAEALEIRTGAEKATAEALQMRTEAEETKAQADAKATAADVAIADAEARAKIADRAVAEAEKIIGKQSEAPEDGDDSETAKAEAPASGEGEAVDEGSEKEADRSSPSKPVKDGDTAVAKEKSKPKANSTPLEAPKSGDTIVKPGSAEGKSTVEASEKPTAKAPEKAGDEPEKESEAAVAKESPAPKQNSTPVETPSAGEIIVKPASDANKTVPDASKENLAKPTVKQSSGAGHSEPVVEKSKISIVPVSAEKGGDRLAKAAGGRPTVASKKTQDKAAKAKPESDDPKTRLWILVLSVLTL